MKATKRAGRMTVHAACFVALFVLVAVNGESLLIERTWKENVTMSALFSSSSCSLLTTTTVQ